MAMTSTAIYDQDHEKPDQGVENAPRPPSPPAASGTDLDISGLAVKSGVAPREEGVEEGVEEGAEEGVEGDVEEDIEDTLEAALDAVNDLEDTVDRLLQDIDRLTGENGFLLRSIKRLANIAEEVEALEERLSQRHEGSM